MCYLGARRGLAGAIDPDHHYRNGGLGVNERVNGLVEVPVAGFQESQKCVPERLLDDALEFHPS